MANASKTAAPRPAKPHKDFPLFPHRSGQWAKKIKGRVYYFGSWRTDPAGVEALEDYTRDLPYLLRGQTPPPIDVSGGCTIEELCNEFMDSKAAAVEQGDLSPRTLADYHQTVKLLAEHFGRTRAVPGLTPFDFREFRSALAKRFNTNSLKSVVNKICVVFKFGLEAKLLSQPVDFGGEFKRPSAKAQRRERNQRGPKLFNREEILRLLETPNVHLRAMILLGVNCGFGNSDVATLPQSALDLERGWVTFPRVKTEIRRRVPLWPETIQALRESLANRPEPAGRKHAGLCFLTSHGLPYVRVRERVDEEGNRSAGTPLDSVSMEFGKLLKKLGINGRRGLGFYTLRHCFETIGGEAKDQVAVDAIMGHVDPSMGGNYRHAISDDRLRAVVNVVREWLFPKEEELSSDEGGAA